MSNRIKSICLVLVYTVIIFFIGCIPEDSLEWSEDGSVGLLRVDEALFLVDGETGQLTEIAKENIQPWPDISKDGSMIAYSRRVDCNNLSEGLKIVLEASTIEEHAKYMRNEILKAGGLTNDKFPEPFPDELKPEEIKNWIVRYMCENADQDLIDVLGKDGIKLGKEKTLNYYECILVSRNNLNDKRVIKSNLYSTIKMRISPDNKYIAHLQQNFKNKGNEMQSLHIAEPDSKKVFYLPKFGNFVLTNVEVSQSVAFGYDWNKNTKKLVYLNQDFTALSNGFTFGALCELFMDPNMAPQYSKGDSPEENAEERYNLNKSPWQRAGTIFYPGMKAVYGIEDRIFFSTIKMSLPASRLNDELVYSIFCYDPVTDSVTDIMPPEASVYASKAISMLQFDLSPDGKYVLVPIKKNRFLEFKLGTNEVELPLLENEGFGEEDVSKLLPAYKGNNEISFLVSEDNHYLAEAGRDPDNSDRYEIIVLNRDNGKARILSESWPDEIMDALEN